MECYVNDDYDQNFSKNLDELSDLEDEYSEINIPNDEEVSLDQMKKNISFYDLRKNNKFKQTK